MGDTQSVLSDFSLPPLEESDGKQPCLVIRDDCMTLLYADSTVRSAVSKALSEERLVILREEMVEDEWWTCTLRRRVFKKDSVFSESENQELRGLRLSLLNRLLAEMERAGFDFRVSLKLLRKCPDNYSTLTWREQTRGSCVMPDNEFLCVDLVGQDKLSIVHSEADKRMTVVRLIEDEVKGLVRYTNDIPNGVEMKFSADLWNVRRVSGEGRFLLLRLFEGLSADGWSAVSGVNLSDDDTLVFKRSTQSGNQGQHKFILMSLEQHNLIRLVSRDSTINNFIYETIGSNWLNHGGVMQTSSADGSMVVQLNGSPWRTYKYSKESIATKWMFADLFEKCAANGWWPVCAFDKSDNSKSIYVLQSIKAFDCSVMAIACAGKWMVRVMHAPRPVIDIIKQTIHKKWYKEIYLEQVDDTCWLINLGGNPWAKEVIPGLSLIVHISAALKKMGWDLFLSAKSSGIYDNGTAYDVSSQERKKYHQAEIDTLWYYKTNEAADAESNI